MCGSATHPGGGIMGAPARNCALRILGQKKSTAITNNVQPRRHEDTTKSHEEDIQFVALARL